MIKGRMQRLKFRNRPRISQYEVECGAHGCATTTIAPDPASLKVQGWHLDKRGGYGWICPKCQEGGPLPEDQGVSMPADGVEGPRSAPVGASSRERQARAESDPFHTSESL